MCSIGLDFMSGPCFVFRENELLVSDSPDILLPPSALVRRCVEENYAKDWFAETPAGYYAVMLEESAPTPAGCRWLRLRVLFAEGNPLSGLACRALALLNWRVSARFCGCCGGPAADDKYETARRCVFCGHMIFPRISPAVIVVVEKGDTILLARHSQRNTDVYTCLAGYVEHGETLEECVEREVFEETALKITDIRYVGSQSWPYPDQLMAAYHARWKSGDIRLQRDEIDDADWFRRDSLPPIPKPGSVAYKLIHNVM